MLTTYFANKPKLRLLCIGAVFMCFLLVFLCALFCMLIIIGSNMHWGLWIFFGLFIPAFLFFISVTAVQTYKLAYKNNPVLIITPEGIINNSSSLHSEKNLIKWEEIKSIRCREVYHRRYHFTYYLLLLDLYNPEAFIKKHSNPFVRFVLSLTNRIEKTPVIIDINYIDKNVKYESIVQAFEANRCFIDNVENLKRLG
ncbi:MAG: hypothetical protein IPJ81_12440 [Chitinophagaceae bacterium]|nr:hypothetical protein [Chitinophagaceae bacterium]